MLSNPDWLSGHEGSGFCLTATHLVVEAKVVNELEHQIKRLVEFFKMPTHENIIFIFEIDIKYNGADKILSNNKIKSIQQFVTEFDRILNSGYSWINLNYAGAIDQTAVVIVELPKSTSNVPRHRVSINLSGPLRTGQIFISPN